MMPLVVGIYGTFERYDELGWGKGLLFVGFEESEEPTPSWLLL